MSEKTEPKFLILGAVSGMAVAAVCMRCLTLTVSDTGRSYFLLRVNLFRFIIYFLWLLVQIIKSALSVSGVALTKVRAVDPSIAWFRADYANPAARALLANSITLTPGTVTIDITDDGIFSVHALTADAREGLLDGSMQNKVAWVYGEKIDFTPIEPSEITVRARLEESSAPKIFRARRKVQ